MEEMELYLANKQVENGKLLKIIDQKDRQITALTEENN